MILVGGKPEYLERNLSHCQFKHHKSHIIIPNACLLQINFLHRRMDFRIIFSSSVCVYIHIQNVKFFDCVMLFI